MILLTSIMDSQLRTLSLKSCLVESSLHCTCNCSMYTYKCMSLICPHTWTHAYTHTHTHVLTGEGSEFRAVIDGSHPRVWARETAPRGTPSSAVGGQLERASYAETTLWAAGERDEPRQKTGKEDPRGKVRGRTVLSRGSGTRQKGDSSK